jgi:hypothetical protein
MVLVSADFELSGCSFYLGFHCDVAVGQGKNNLFYYAKRKQVRHSSDGKITNLFSISKRKGQKKTSTGNYAVEGWGIILL